MVEKIIFLFKKCLKRKPHSSSAFVFLFSSSCYSSPSSLSLWTSRSQCPQRSDTSCRWPFVRGKSSFMKQFTILIKNHIKYSHKILPNNGIIRTSNNMCVSKKINIENVKAKHEISKIKKISVKYIINISLQERNH